MSAPSTPDLRPDLRGALRGLDRRRFLTVLPRTGAFAAPAGSPADITSDPFTLAVASGDPLPDSVLLWTRLAPLPLEPTGGMPPSRFDVGWEVARDAAFRRVVRRGTTAAHTEFNHSVHAEVRGLDAATEYFYRFRVGRWISPVGRTRTAPAVGAAVSSLTFALASCQRYDQGYYTAYKHLAGEDVDAVFHLGDYLYEYAVNASGGTRGYTEPLPAHLNHETVTLDDYRARYGLYKSDPDQIAAHLAHPFIVTWDDHETENNYAGDTPENSVPPEEFLVRRAAAYRAYWENQPLRLPQQPSGPDLRLYRRLHWGRLAQFDILDTRQYRTNQANGDGWKVPSAESEAESMTLPGIEQEQWLIDGWRRSSALWNIVPQQVTFSRRDNPSGDGTRSMDSWDGYPASRRRILEGWKASEQSNLMVLTGDVHVHYGLNIHDDFDDPSSRIMGTEVVTTSITSGGNGAEHPANWAAYLERNPHMKFYNGLRGYTTLSLGAAGAEITYKTVAQVSTPGAPLTVGGRFVTESGKPGLVEV
jgi:alkaline phosphatase D